MLWIDGTAMTTTSARGVAAGAVGVLAMDVVTWLMYQREDTGQLLRERRARVFGKDTAHALVRRVAQAVGSDAGRQQPNGAGQLHQRRRMRHLTIERDPAEPPPADRIGHLPAQALVAQPVAELEGTSSADRSPSASTAGPSTDRRTARTARRTPGRPAAHPPAPAPRAAASPRPAAPPPTRSPAPPASGTSATPSTAWLGSRFRASPAYRRRRADPGPLSSAGTSPRFFRSK
jgi:hypothetical protein